MLYKMKIKTAPNITGIYPIERINSFKHFGFLLVNKNGANITCKQLRGAGNEISEEYSLSACVYGLSFSVSSI